MKTARNVREVRVPADITSQFVSGLLLAGPCMPNGIDVTLAGEVVSAPSESSTTARFRTSAGSFIRARSRSET